ncbi:hypothetical protein D3C79_49810 [compost metagenome]
MSLLQFLGVGTVTATKETDSDEIMVYCPFLFPQAEGRMSANAEQVERVSKNAYNEEVRSVTLKSNSIPAVWKKMDDSNRISSPDVREGTPVAIYHIAGQNQYYWTLDGVNPNTLRMETVMYGWNANPEVEENGDYDVDNFYIFAIDTRSGLVQFRTSERNGEASKFDIQINTKDGTITIGAKNHSMLNLNDVDHSFTYTNEEGALLRIEKKEGTLYLPDRLSIFADNTFNLKTKQINIQAEEANIDIGLTRWKGKVERTGDTSQIGNWDLTGNYEQVGFYQQEGDTRRTGNSYTSGFVWGFTDVRTMTVSLNLHLHGGVRGGEDTTSVPLPS